MTFEKWVLASAVAGIALVVVMFVATKAFLAASRVIDSVNLAVGRAMLWLVLFAVLISTGNAIIRKLFDRSSNAFLEVQWYLFGAVFMLCAAYTLLRNEHVRIDVISSRYSRRTLAKIDVFGFVFFLLPMSGILLYLSWPVFKNSVAKPRIGETEATLGQVMNAILDPSQWEWSVDAGGLMRWPAKILIPIGFLLLSLQGISELTKRVAFLRGMIPDPNEKAAAHGTVE